MGHWLDYKNDRVGTNFTDFLNPMTLPAALATSYVKSRPDAHAAITPVEKLALNLNAIEKILYTNGFPGPASKWAAAQSALESANWTSNVSLKDGNYSGIKWVNKPYQKATRGEKSPEGNYYAKYANPAAWAKDYKRVLSVGPNAPINATNVDDYVNRLQAHKYFTSSPMLYKAGLLGILNAQGQGTQAVDTRDKTLQHEIDDSGIPTWGKWAIGIGGGFMLINMLTK